MSKQDRYRGCMIGGAAGDALGYAVEFLPEEEIFKQYGERGITEYALTNGVAQISDDTQMSLFTAEGLLACRGKGKARGAEESLQMIARGYRDWYKTQTQSGPKSGERYFTRLATLPELYSRRAPGNTCISALEQETLGSVQRPINRSKGCGGIMRVAPIGLCFTASEHSMEWADSLGAEAAALTHGHELGYIPAAALVHMVSLLSHDEDQTILSAVRDALATMPKLFPEAASMPAFLALMEKAIELSAQGLDDLDGIRELGQGWVAEETLAIAVYCALKYKDDFQGALIAAVNHSGDSDSTGAVTGNILGAYVGYQAIPRKFTERLELRDVILALADELAGE